MLPALLFPRLLPARHALTDTTTVVAHARQNVGIASGLFLFRAAMMETLSQMMAALLPVPFRLRTIVWRPILRVPVVNALQTV